jgi:transcriptional regulator with XRE-family HTH domain
MNYGKALRLARVLANLNQKELADRAGLDPSHVSLIEKGTRRPSLAALEKLSSALRIPNDLFILMAAEKKELKLREPKELQRAFQSMARLLLEHVPAKEKPARKKLHSPKT